MQMPSESARRTQAERRTRSEEALLDAAAELVAERGVDGASLASIGGRAGVSRGLPTHHFGSKDTLVARLAQRSQERIASAMMATLESHSLRVQELSGLDLVYQSVDSYLELFERPSTDERALLVMWGSTFPSSSSVEGMIEAERRSYDGLSEVIAAGSAGRVDQNRRRPDGLRRPPPWHDARRRGSSLDRLGHHRHAARAQDVRRLDHLVVGGSRPR